MHSRTCTENCRLCGRSDPNYRFLRLQTISKFQTMLSSEEISSEIPSTTSIALPERTMARKRTNKTADSVEVEPAIVKPITTTIDTRPQEVKALDRRDSKTSLKAPEITKKDSTIFHQYFPKVKEDLIEEFVCAIPMTILVQGKLYVTEKRICFYPYFGTNIKIFKFDDIQKIDKAVTFPYIPNGIDVTLKDGTVQRFQSFIYRDFTHSFLFQLWMSRMAKKLTNPVDSPLSSSPEPESLTLADETLETSTESQPDVCDCHAQFHSGKELLVDLNLPLNPSTLYISYYEKFLVDFLVSNQKVQDFYSDFTSSSTVCGTEFKMSYKIPLGLYTPTTSITTSILKFSDTCICLESITTTPDVPYGSTFQTRVRTCLQSVKEGTTRLLMSFDLEWIGQVNWIVKAAVKSQLGPKIQEYHSDLKRILLEKVGGMIKDSETPALSNVPITSKEATVDQSKLYDYLERLEKLGRLILACLMFNVLLLMVLVLKSF